VPTRLDAVAEKLVGSTLADADIRGAIADVIDGVEIMVDAHASPDYRRRAAGALARRAIAEARETALASGRNRA
jgi:CO/xanthine dehydrogenase FAD-binding subunit